MEEFRSMARAEASYRSTFDELITRGDFHDIENHERIFAKADDVVFALDSRGDMVAFALIINLRDVWNIEYVMTRPGYEKQGFATAVLDHINGEASCRKVHWLSLRCNDQRLKFYQNLGYSVVDSH